MTPQERDALRAAHARVRDTILGDLGQEPAQRAAAAIVLAELAAVIEGVDPGFGCLVCARPLGVHDEQQIHDCTAKLRAHRASAFPPRRCTMHEWRNGPQCTNEVAPDKISLCAGPHAFEPATPAHIEAKGKLNPEKPLRKLALVVSTRSNESAAQGRGPGEPR